MTRPALARMMLAAAAAAAAACERGSLTGPPQLRLGRDECGECGMLVCEERSAAAMLIEGEAGRAHVVFDDAGCLLDYESERADELRVLGRFARDHESGAWIDADAAHFLLASPDRLPTPMGSGIAAFAAGGGAARARERVGGEVLSLASLRTARRDWRAARFGAPGAER